MSIGRDSLRKSSPTTVKASKSKTPPPNPTILVISPPPKRPKNEAINTVGLPKVKKSPFLLETPTQPSGLRPRKRPSLSQNDIENGDSIKRPRKEMSYSKPGMYNFTDDILKSQFIIADLANSSDITTYDISLRFSIKDYRYDINKNFICICMDKIKTKNTCEIFMIIW